MKEHIHQSNLIENIDSPKADEQSMKAWKWLEKQPKITKSVLLETHRLITESQDDLRKKEKGAYRTVGVIVGGRICPAPELVPHMMDNWLLDFKDRNPIANHVLFEKIHPFVDGNGRTGRMIFWWQQIKSGEEPLLISADKRDEYYKWFTGGKDE